MSKKECKGLYFRKRESFYTNKDSTIFTAKTEIRLLKRDSCKCPMCQGALERLDIIVKDSDCLPEFIGCGHNGLYKLIIDTWDEYDFECHFDSRMEVEK